MLRRRLGMPRPANWECLKFPKSCRIHFTAHWLAAEQSGDIPTLYARPLLTDDGRGKVARRLGPRLAERQEVGPPHHCGTPRCEGCIVLVSAKPIWTAASGSAEPPSNTPRAYLYLAVVLAQVRVGSAHHSSNYRFEGTRSCSPGVTCGITKVRNASTTGSQSETSRLHAI